MNLITKIKDKGWENVARSALYKIISKNNIKKFRSHFRKKRMSVWNEVTVPEDIAPSYRTIDRFISLERTDYDRSEGAEVSMHEKYTNRGDRVVIIGGGRGVTAVRAAQKTGPTGEVVIYEASKKYAGIIKKITGINNVSSICNVKNKLVGKSGDIFDDYKGSKSENKSVKDIEECEVLEMDCEGGEGYIIEKMEIEPRLVIVEIHAQKIENPHNVIRNIEKKGYEITDRLTNRGSYLTKDEFDRVIEECANGIRMAPVVAAQRKMYTR